MKVTVMSMFVAEGTTTECAEYTAKTMLILKELSERLEQSEIQKEIQNIWKNITKDGDNPK